MQHQTVLILDFGSQYTQLIARRVRENRVYCEIEPCDLPVEEIRRRAPVGLILSGGPDSVYGEDAPRSSAELFDLGIPVLGICYGMQLIAHQLGGRVEGATSREYGRAEIELLDREGLFDGLAGRETVWMSHGDRICEAPPGFRTLATTGNAPVVAFAHAERRIYGIQFHPEVSHTVHGGEVLRNFLYAGCGAEGDWSMASYVDEAAARVREQVTRGKVICALSGGVDSAVTAALLERAVGDRMVAIFVDNGVLRKGECRQVEHSLKEALGVPLVTVDARQRFLSELAGVSDPEAKRKTIGRVFIEVFQDEASRLDDAAYLAQGTLYPDVIESVSVKGPSAVIKSHHNVGGLPDDLHFGLVEPLRDLFKDEVRKVGEALGLPESIV
ncbi:MAG: glutamine-hydrolyzing GMP synthase, partial [Acidobacteria bacterium]|nr:glutamine-hydrolyzing GMP synthase [Acidobacteriota bacterium]